jgi:hypothetical protein
MPYDQVPIAGQLPCTAPIDRSTVLDLVSGPESPITEETKQRLPISLATLALIFPTALSLLTIEYHPGVMQNPVDEIAICRKARVADIFNMITGYFIAPLIRALSPAAGFNVATIGKQFMPDEPVLSNCRVWQRMAQPFRQVAAEVELYFRVCLTISQKHAISLPHL